MKQVQILSAVLHEKKERYSDVSFVMLSCNRLQGHNIVLVSNHQTEADPAVIALLLETTNSHIAENLVTIFPFGILVYKKLVLSHCVITKIFLLNCRLMLLEIGLWQTLFASPSAWEGAFEVFIYVLWWWLSCIPSKRLIDKIFGLYFLQKSYLRVLKETHVWCSWTYRDEKKSKYTKFEGNGFAFEVHLCLATVLDFIFFWIACACIICSCYYFCGTVNHKLLH